MKIESVAVVALRYGSRVLTSRAGGHMLKPSRLGMILSAILMMSGVARGNTTVISFEGVLDSTAVASLCAGQGLTFSSGLIVVSGAFGGSLNEVDFPPMAPGQAVFLNEADVTTLNFLTPILSFSGHFTYGGPLTLNFYGAGNVLLTTVVSGFLTNIGTGGDPGSSPNELLAAGSLANAVRVDVLAPGADFTMDDLS